MTQQYKIYLQSAQWQRLRNAVIARSCEGIPNANPNLGVCEICHYRPWKPGVLQVHHLTYANLYHEHLTDLQLVCPNCHKKLTQKQKANKESVNAK
jgi:5-methylcytosine-specific restriction endonuclease McrA